MTQLARFLRSCRSLKARFPLDSLKALSLVSRDIEMCVRPTLWISVEMSGRRRGEVPLLPSDHVLPPLISTIVEEEGTVILDAKVVAAWEEIRVWSAGLTVMKVHLTALGVQTRPNTSTTHRDKLCCIRSIDITFPNIPSAALDIIWESEYMITLHQHLMPQLTILINLLQHLVNGATSVVKFILESGGLSYYARLSSFLNSSVLGAMILDVQSKLFKAQERPALKAFGTDIPFESFPAQFLGLFPSLIIVGLLGPAPPSPPPESKPKAKKSSKEGSQSKAKALPGYEAESAPGKDTKMHSGVPYQGKVTSLKRVRVRCIKDLAMFEECPLVEVIFNNPLINGNTLVDELIGALEPWRDSLQTLEVILPRDASPSMAKAIRERTVQEKFSALAKFDWYRDVEEEVKVSDAEAQGKEVDAASAKREGSEAEVVAGEEKQSKGRKKSKSKSEKATQGSSSPSLKPKGSNTSTASEATRRSTRNIGTQAIPSRRK